jgi:hypothetical protein
MFSMSRPPDSVMSIFRGSAVVEAVKRVQSKAEWGSGCLKRMDYHFRDHTESLL